MLWLNHLPRSFKVGYFRTFFANSLEDQPLYPMIRAVIQSVKVVKSTFGERTPGFISPDGIAIPPRQSTVFVVTGGQIPSRPVGVR